MLLLLCNGELSVINSALDRRAINTECDALGILALSSGLDHKSKASADWDKSQSLQGNKYVYSLQVVHVKNAGEQSKPKQSSSCIITTFGHYKTV